VLVLKAVAGCNKLDPVSSFEEEDQEPDWPGEDEMAAARRLLTRVMSAFPRAFDLVLADAFHAKTYLFKFLLARGKHALVVLKEERLNFYGPLSSSKRYANYPSHLSAGQKRFRATLNPSNSHRILPSSRNRCSGGKFVVSGTGEA
jgi:hypothetical protein